MRLGGDKDQTIRMSFGGNESKARNLGVGAYNLSTRAYGNESSGYNFMLQEVGPLGRRFFINTRSLATIRRPRPVGPGRDDDSRAGLVYGRRRPTDWRPTYDFNYTVASDLDYVRGIHSWPPA